MTTEELKTLLYNIFGYNFLYDISFDTFDCTTPNGAIVTMIKRGLIYIYPSLKSYDGLVSLLNNKPEYGYIIFANKKDGIIQFILYSNLKNLDI